MTHLATILIAMVLALARGSSAEAYGLATDFGTDGIATAGPGTARAVVLQPDGRIVAAGSGLSEVMLGRFLLDGTLDPSFGIGGVVVSPMMPSAEALARQDDGKLVVAGSSTGVNRDFVVGRFLDDGSLDTSFGSGGVVATDLDDGSQDEARAVLVQPDGKIVVGGRAGGSMALARYLSDGSPDPTFGGDGRVLAPGAPFTGHIYRLVLQLDGKIVAGGYSAAAAKVQPIVARFSSDGTLDSTFGDGGRVTTRLGAPGVVTGLAVQPDGRIVAAASGGGKEGRFILIRYETDGRLDPSFGTGGISSTEISSAAEEIYAIDIRPDDAIVAGGQVLGHIGPIARYTADGKLERGYGVCGTAIAEIAMYDLEIEPGGSVIGAGYYQGEFAVARFGVAAEALCPEVPASSCKPGASKLMIRDGSKNDKLAWQWRGSATTLAELGTPLEDDYTLCVYDESTDDVELVYAARVPAGFGCAGKDCWKATGTGYKYADAWRSPCGVSDLALVAGLDGEARATLKGGGPLLGPPALPLAIPARVQLRASNGTCWNATYSAAEVQRNDAAGFKARAD